MNAHAFKCYQERGVAIEPTVTSLDSVQLRVYLKDKRREGVYIAGKMAGVHSSVQPFLGKRCVSRKMVTVTP
jgi:hypothetical protein